MAQVVEFSPRPPEFLLLAPEVPGGWGEEIVADRSTHPPLVSRLHIYFDGWLGDDLLTSFPNYFVTPRLADALSKSRLSGFALAPMLITKSGVWEQLHPDRPLPECQWLQVTGRAGVDDFGLAALAELIVSKKAYRWLRQFQLTNCESAQWTP